MTDVSISDVKVKLRGVDFTLRATTATLVRIEQETGIPYAVVFNRLGRNIPRMTDASICFAAMALPHGKHAAEAIRAIIPFAESSEGLRELAEGVDKAVVAASPEPKPGTAEAGKADSDPQLPR